MWWLIKLGTTLLLDKADLLGCLLAYPSLIRTWHQLIPVEGHHCLTGRPLCITMPHEMQVSKFCLEMLLKVVVRVNDLSLYE